MECYPSSRRNCISEVLLIAIRLESNVHSFPWIILVYEVLSICILFWLQFPINKDLASLWTSQLTVSLIVIRLLFPIKTALQKSWCCKLFRYRSPAQPWNLLIVGTLQLATDCYWCNQHPGETFHVAPPPPTIAAAPFTASGGRDTWVHASQQPVYRYRVQRTHSSALQPETIINSFSSNIDTKSICKCGWAEKRKWTTKKTAAREPLRQHVIARKQHTRTRCVQCSVCTGRLFVPLPVLCFVPRLGLNVPLNWVSNDHLPTTHRIRSGRLKYLH